MLTVAFLANVFPCALESYVMDEIDELRRRGVRVIPGSVRRAASETEKGTCPAEITVLSLRISVIARALWLCVRRFQRLAPLLGRIVYRGQEGPWQRAKALSHTFLGACYAVRLQGSGVEHIHVHHGYFGSWIGMTAARLLGVPFSMTLYGSDLLLHRAYLDTKLGNCVFCQNVSEFNRQFILKHYPRADPAKLPVVRLGVDLPERLSASSLPRKGNDSPFVILAVGRLHPVKDHAFLVRACAELHHRCVPFECFIVGDGPEREKLEIQIRECHLDQDVHLLGYVSQDRRDSLYEKADVVVLTSRSEGIPVVLMEAMARGRIVLAPAITGIPELVIPGKTGFLYEPGVIADFVERLVSISGAANRPHGLGPCEQAAEVFAEACSLDEIRAAARMHVNEAFNRKKNVERFAELLLQWAEPHYESFPDENSVLQQIQPSV